MEGKIVDFSEYGRHIYLKCKNHPDLVWNTKNIAPLGCRTVFFRYGESECSCDISCLIPLSEEETKNL